MRTYLWLVAAGAVGIIASLGCSSSDDDKSDPVNAGGNGGSAGAIVGNGGDAGSGEAGNGQAGNGQAGNGNGECALSTNDAACDGCFQSKCESQCAAASADPDLDALLGCFQSCGSDQSCMQNCANQYESAYSKLDALDGCMSTQCAAECGGGSGGCGLTTQNAACDGCFQVKCETECAAATSDPNLNALLGCLQSCGSDQSCMQNCVNQYPDAYSKLAALDSCMGSQCAAECGGGSGGCGLTTNNAACDNCFHAACANECSAAMSDPNLNALLACVQGCGSDQACLQGCVNQYPDAYSKLAALDSCMGTNCASQCGMKTTRQFGFQIPALVSRLRSMQ